MILATQPNAYQETKNIISSNQFGFRNCKSTEDQLILTYADIAAGLDFELVVDVGLLDFSKAFDFVAHSVFCFVS